MRQILTLALVLLPSVLAAQTPLRTYSDAFIQRYDRTAPKVDYTVTVKEGDRSAYFVELGIANAPNPARLVIPEWAPGAYRRLQSAQNITDVAAFTAAGEPLAVTPDSLNGWTVDTKGAATVVVRYAASDRRPAGFWTRANNRWFLLPTSGLIDGPRTFMYLDGWKLTPAHVRFHLPPGWRIATGLIPTTDSTVYWAPSYDVLIDSPVLVGQFVTHHFTAGGVPHRAVMDLNGDSARYDAGAFVDMLRKICETTIEIFGTAPYTDYTFIFTGAGGGLEHLNSTTIGIDPARLARDPTYRRETTAHEFFHTWNVKRIRPAELGPFDYTRPVRTLGLWLSEGVTDYYADLILVRAGLDSVREFERKIGSAITSHRGNPGRLTISPERASWTTWDEPQVNGGQSISYYLQGQLLGLLLDLTIRDSTDNRKSLDDVMRYLFDHYAGERGFTSEDVLNAVLAETGLDLQVFWGKYVSGTAEIPWNEFLAKAGWWVDFTPAPGPDLRLRATNPTVQGALPRAVMTPGSAAARAGLRAGDELAEINGRPITTVAEVALALRGLQIGDSVTIHAVRDGAPFTVRYRVPRYTDVAGRLRDLPALSERMRRIRAGIVTGR
ncbi:MAG: M61 family metallopeptidase [Gemmatimonadetes bacterium]|nr:M61 family metallopeptidase [Gemmatimonadota bacterium]